MSQPIPCPRSTADGLGINVFVEERLKEATGGCPYWASNTDLISWVAVQPQEDPDDTNLLIWGGIAEIIMSREGGKVTDERLGGLLETLVAGGEAIPALHTTLDNPTQDPRGAS